MADKIVSWGGFDSKGTSGMGITGSLGILNTNTSSSVLLDISGSANNSLTFISNPVLSSGQQNGLKVNVSTAGYDNNGSHIAYNFQVGGTSYFTIANYGLGTFSQGISTKVMLIQGNPSSTTSLIVYAQGSSGNAIETGGSEGTVHLGSNTVNTKVNEILRITGKGTTSSTTAFRVQNANASASLQVRDDQSIIINGSSSMTIANSGSALTLTRTGDYSNIGTKPLLNIIDSTGGANEAKTGIYISITGATANRAIEAYGGVGFGITPLNNQFSVAYPINITNTITATSANNNYVLTLKSLTSLAANAGTGISFWGDDRAQGTALSAFAGIRGIKENSTYLNSLGNLAFYVQTGSAGGLSESTYREVARFNSSGSLGIGTSSPAASLHISGSSNSVLLEIDSPAVNNIIYVSGSGNVGIGTGTPTSRLTVAGNVDIGGNFIGNIASSQYINFIGVGTGEFRFNNGGGGGWFYTWVQNGSERMRLSTSNNLLIGTTSDSARLTVQGSGATSSTTSFLVQNSSGTTLLQTLDDATTTLAGKTFTGTGTILVPAQSHSASDIVMKGDSALISANGNANQWGKIVLSDVGANTTYQNSAGSHTFKIGTTSPTTYLTIAANNITTGPSTRIQMGAQDASDIYQGTGANVYGSFLLFGSTGNTVFKNSYTAGAYQFFTAPSVDGTLVEALRIVASGNVGIGKTTPTYKLDVSGSGNFTSNLTITGSATISSVLTLTPQTPLPSGVPTGSFAVSSSAPPKPYFYDGTAWNALY